MFKYFFLSSYVGVSQLTAAVGTCTVNGQPTDCGELAGVMLPFIGIMSIFIFAIVVFGLVCLWKVFVKAGYEGWKAIIPIYNIIIMLRIINKPWWWVFLFFVPYVSIVMSAILYYYLAKSFGKDGWFAAGLFFLSPIFMGILAFGKATYVPIHSDSLSGTPMPPPPVAPGMSQ